MVAPGFPTKIKDPQPLHPKRFHGATVGAKNVWWEQVVRLSPGDIIYREIERIAISIVDIIHEPFLDTLVDLFSIAIPNDAGCKPRKATFWKNETPWPLSMDTVLCGETWIDIVTGPNGMLDPMVPDAAWDLAREWIVLSLNRANGINPPESILQASIEAEVILADCDVDTFEVADAAALEDTLGKFNNMDQDTVGFTCMLGEFTGNIQDDIQHLEPILRYNHGAITELLSHVVITGTIIDELTDPQNAILPVDVGLSLRSYDQYVYTLQDAVQPTVDQRPGLA